MAKKQNNPQPQATTNIDTDIFVKGMTKDPNSSLVGKDQWTHARNAINNSTEGDVGTLGNEPANKECSSAPFTIIGTIHLYGDKWILFSTNNTQSVIGTWDDSECKYVEIINDHSCYMCADQFAVPGAVASVAPFGPCLNFNTQHLITGAAKENFDCSWQVYWDDGVNPSRTLNLDNIPYHKRIISDEGADCLIYETMEPLCLDCEQIRLAPLIDIPCVTLSKSSDGGQLRNGSYQVFIGYAINDQIVGDYYGISNIQPLFDHEDLASGLEINISNLDKDFEFFQLVIFSVTQGEPQAKNLGFYSTEQSNISIDYINQALPVVPLDILPLSTPAYEKSDKMYVVNDYLIRQGPTEQFDFNYQPLANNIHVHYTVTEFPSDYYKNGGNKPTFMRDEQYCFFIRFIYNTGEKSSSYHIPGRAPYNWQGITDPAGGNPNVLDPWPGNNDLGTASWINNGSVGPQTADRLFEVHNTADDGWPYVAANTSYNPEFTEDGGRVVREGHMGYWESTERYPQDPVRWGDLCGQPIRHHKMPDESTAFTELIADPAAVPSGVGPNNYLDRSSNNNTTINVLGVRFMNVAWPRFNGSTDDVCSPPNGAPEGDLIPNIVGYEILVGSREGNKSIIAKGLARNMREYPVPEGAQGHEVDPGQELTGYIANYPFNDCGQDVYLSASDKFSSVRSGTAVDADPSPASMTATNVFTFHSPETSFNKPFLSPYEFKSYGICTGTSSGRFKPSELHPQHKLLRNSAMWIAIIVGVGYAISEMRGKRSKNYTLPKALSMGLSGKGKAHGGNSTNIVMTPGTAFANAYTTIATTTSPGFTENTTARSGGEWEEAAPSSNNDGGLQTDGNTEMMLDYNGGPTGLGVGANFGGPVGAEALLTTSTVIGAPKLWNMMPGTGYQRTLRNASKNWGNNRGFIGYGEEIHFEGSRFESAPALTQLITGVYNFMAFTATGGQEIIDLIYNLVSYQDYAWKYGAQGLYFSTQQRTTTEPFRALINKGRYIGSSIQNLTADIRINNLQRPKTVAISTITTGADFTLPLSTQDNSRYKIGDFEDWFNPSVYRKRNIAAHYTALKVAFRNQYGQLDQIKQLPVGCITYFKDQQKTSSDGNLLAPTVDSKFVTGTIYGGDCYLNRYSEKVIMPFFWDFLNGQPDGFPYDYKLRSNVPRPIHWMDTSKFELSEVVREIVDLSFLIGTSTGDLAASLPSGKYFLDRPGGPGFTGANDYTEDDFGGSSGGGPGSTSAGGPTNNNAPEAVAPGTDTGGRSLFHIKNGYMYTHCNGINEFYVESTINTALRDWEDVDKKRHYDQLEFTDVEALFDAKIIRDDNFYKYDSSLSSGRFSTKLISYGFIQPRDYDPLVSEDCYVHYPKRLMYSLQAQKEAKKDFWRVFLPYNYKDFKNKVNVIKPISKSGAMILFPNLSPTMFQGVDQLETELGTKLTIGDGGLFSQPMQNIVNADTAYEYGSCESARSVVNTPSGLFYISQAQGKVFHYTGKGLVNIANQGMKQWFNKYLPSMLLAQYPGMEHCDSWIDNPVAGVGCQTVYDPNYDLIYFCKKDYEVTIPECVDYVPCEGFVYNNTTCNNIPTTPCCPDGYTYIPATSTTDERCEIYSYEPALIQQDSGAADIVFTVDSSNSVDSQDNVGNTQKFVRTITDTLSAELGAGTVKIGFTHFGGGRCALEPLFNGQTCTCPACTAPDEMFQPGNQITLTSDVTIINNFIGTPGSPFTALTGWPPDYTSIYGQNSQLASGQDFPPGTDLLAGMWTGLNVLYGDGSRQVPKILITIFDGPQFNHGNNPLTSYGYSSTPYTFGGVTGTDVYQNMVVNPLTADVGPFPAQANNWNLNAVEDTWFTNNVLNNSAYNAAPYIQKNISVVVDTGGTIPFATKLAYAQQFASSNGDTYGGSFQNESLIEDIANEIAASITPPPVYSCADPDATLLQNAAGQWMCERTQLQPVVHQDNVTPIEFGDPYYFNDVSWTVSYDPKYEAWMSFHDWHPQLVIPSLNHFFTTNEYEDLTTTPSCPPGFTWNPTTQVCCQTFEGEYEADIIVEEVPVEFDQELNACALDIAIVLDCSGSNGWTNGTTTAASFANAFLTAMDARMDGSLTGVTGANIVQVGLGTYTTFINLPGNGGPNGSQVMQTMSSDSSLVNVTGSQQGFGQADGGGDGYDTAITIGLNILNDYANSTFGDRSGQANYKRIMIILTDAGSGAASCTPLEYTNAPDNMTNNVWALGIDTIAVKLEAADPANWQTFNANDTATVQCLVQTMADAYRIGPGLGAALGTQIANSLCVEPPTCNCPTGFERISTQGTSTAPPYVVLGPTDDCETKGRNGVCRKMECECDENQLPFPSIPVTQTGDCPTDILNGIALYYNEDTGVGNPTWTNPMPRTCHFDYECCLEGTTSRGGIWKHNDRCDLYANYYGDNYPWEIEWVESVGQTVNTIRSIEYQLESYIYKGNLGDGCGDRFHDLDWNFDHAIIHNTEQVSGLLTLTLDPKNNVPLITQYPIISAGDINILYSKVEQKYRFNMFWDITRNRGEFDPNWNSSIFITQLNGYIRDLNVANLNYFKPAFQRKKFRHYWNKVVLRKDVSENRKMIFKLANTKINASIR